MDTIIKIYNPKDIPFGQLSNNSHYPMTINGKRWNTVTNYIFSNLLVTPEYKSILQYAEISKDSKHNLPDKTLQIIENVQESTGARLTTEDKKRIKKGTTVQKMDIYTMYRHYADLEYIENVRTSLEKAYNSRISENTELMETLLLTENHPILYVSDNSTLGTGEDGHGYNMVGKTLMQIRHNIRLRLNEKNSTQEKEEFENKIFIAYKAFMILQHQLNKGDTLSKYIKKTANQLVLENPTLLLETKVTDDMKPTILQMYNRGLFPIIKKEIENPGSMVITVRKKGLPILKQKAEISRINIVVDLYTEYIVREMNPSWNSNKIKAASLQLFDSLLHLESKEKIPDEKIIANKFSDFKNRIVRLYNSKKLPPQLLKEIDTELEKIHIPDEKELENTEESSIRGESNSDEESPVIDDSEEKTQTDSSSSLDIHDPISKLFTSDEKTKKILLLEKLENYTGITPSRKYRKMSNYELEQELYKFEGPNASQEPAEGVGEWVINVKHKNNKVENLGKSKSRPTPQDLESIVKKYNKEAKKEGLITTKQLFVNWTPYKQVRRVKIDETENKYQKPPISFPDGFIKESGPSVQISSIVSENERYLQPLCPSYQKIETVTDEKGITQSVVENFMIDGLTYPSISIYLTTKLLTQTGKHKDSHNILRKGMSIADARNMLIMPGENYFIEPHEADVLYEKFRDNTENELKEIFARIAMIKKFEDVNLKILLLLTNNSEIIWEDSKDLFLGFDITKDKGINVVGRILMELRDWYTNDKEQKVYFPEVKRDEVEKFINKDPFIISWINMRVNDMSNTVYKFKQYLYNTTEQEEDIDKDFVTFILDKVLQPCSYVIAMSKIIDIPVPEFFTNIISNCKGMTITVDPSYKEDSDRIKEEMRRVVQRYTNTNEIRPFEPKKEFDIIAFSKKQTQDLEEFLKSNPSQEALQEFYAKQKKQSDKILFDKRIGYEVRKANLSENKELSIDAQQRQEWDNLLAKINETEMSPEEIDQKIKALETKQKEELENTDYLLGPREVALKKQQSSEIKALQDSLEMTEEEADKRLQKLEETYQNWDTYAYIESRRKQDPTISDKHLKHEIDNRLRDIDELREKLKNSKLHAVEVKNKIAELEHKYSKIIKKLKKHPDRIKAYVSEKMDLEKYHQEERENLMSEISRVKLSIKERNKKLVELTKKQNEERLIHYNLQPPKKSKEEVAKYQKEMDDFKARLLRINQKVKSIINDKTNVVEQIAQIYWTRITAMISYLLDHIKQANQQDIRKAIASIQMINSRPTTCEFSYENSIVNLNNQDDNCIASAIANILVGINIFKSQYGEDIPFDTPDIDLACSIILNKDISDNKLADKAEEVIDNIGEDILDEIELGSDVGSDLENDDYGDGGDQDFGDDFGDDRSERSDGSFEFGMGKKKVVKINSDIEGIKIILRSIAGKEIKNIDSLAQYFINTITTIKTYKMSNKVKQNRINFFATIR